LAAEVLYRISNWDTPLRVNPNRTAGRYNESGSASTQYLSLHPLTPWAEYLRTNELRDPDDLKDHRLRVWAVRADISAATRIDFTNAEDFEIEAEDLISEDHRACRRLAERLREDSRGPRMIVVPSAALPGTENVVIFGERVPIPYLWTPLDEGDLPACVIAERSQPPAEIDALVRYRGEPHAAFEEWRAGRRYRFPDLRDA
jgi:RES domain-containing protein